MLPLHAARFSSVARYVALLPGRRSQHKGKEMPVDVRRRGIRKGAFLTSTPAPGSCMGKRTPLPAADDVAAFDHKHAAAIAELTRRFEAVRRQLDDLKNRRGSK